MRLSRSDIYRKAAELIATKQQRYACHAINVVVNSATLGIDNDAIFPDTPPAIEFDRMFREFEWNHCYFGDPTPTRQRERVLALLFLAAMKDRA